MSSAIACALLVCAVLATSASSASASYSSIVLGDGPVGYWRFGGAPGSTVMTDSSPSANTGTLLNGVALGQAGALNTDPDKAASFDGVNDSGRVPDANSLDVGSVFTAEAWIKRTATSGSQELYNKGANGLQVTVMNAANGNQVWLRRAGVTTIARSVGGVPADAAYHHVVVTMNGAGTALIYIDAVQNTVQVNPVQPVSNTTFPITVGSAATPPAFFDEFALYPRPLSPAEVLEHFQNATDVPPTAVADGQTVGEDSGATAVDVLANDTDPDGGPKSIASVTQPANGTVVITGGGTGLTYQPNANSCNSPPGTTPDTFTYTLNGGSSTTVSMTVTCVDDSPVAVNDSATVSEDSGASAVSVLVNDTDIDGGPKSIASVTQPANGTVVITGGGTGLTFAPNAQYCNSGGGPADTFTYTLSPGGSSATVSMTVSCADDAPLVDTTSGALAYAENDPPTPIDPGVTVTDADVGGTIASATVQITGNYAGAQDVLALANAVTHLPITALVTGDTITLSGAASPAAYQSALRDVTYANSSQAPSTLTRTATFTATDSTALAGSDTRAIVVTAADDPPTAVNDGATVAEDAAATAVGVLTNDTDIDGGPKSIASVTQPANGTVVITGGGTGLTYQPNANYCNSPPGTTLDTFTYTLTPGSSSATVTMTVTCADDPPVAVNDAKTVAQDSSAAAIAVLVNDTDVDGGTKAIASTTDPAHGTVVLTGGSPGAHTGLTYQPDAGYCNSGGGPDDTFTYTLTPGGSTATVSVTVTCNDVPPTAVNDGATVAEDAGAAAVGVLANDTDPDAGPKSIASVTQPANGTVVITGGGTGLTYQPNANYCNSPPGTTLDTFTYTLTPGSSSATVSMTVSCADDPPVAVNDSATVLEDPGAAAVSVLTNDTDIDGGPKSIASVTQPANGTVVITGGGTGLTYQPNANYCNSPPGTTLDAFTYTLTPGSSSATVTMTVTCVNDAPVADDETFSGTQSAVGNTTLIGDDPSDGPPTAAGPKKTITGDILAGDADADGPGPLVVTAGTFATNDGGTVVLESDGDFTFTPAAGTSCSDTSDFFDYTVSDQNPGTAGTDVGRVTISIAGCVWYVNNNAAGNAGTSTAPFDTLAQAQTASATGDTIFVFDGDNTTTGYGAGVDLKTNQRLLGEAATLQVGADVLQAAVPANRPTITDNNADVVKLASGNTVRGVQIDPQGTGGGIAGGDGTAPGSITGGTIDDVRIIDAGTAGTQPGLELDTTSGTFDVADLTVQNGGSAGAIGVRLDDAGTVNFASAGTISITTAGAKGFEATGPTTSLGAGSMFDDVTVTGSGSGGVSMSGTTGTTTFSSLALTTTSGAPGAFVLSSAGSVTVSSGGTANVSATGGPAVDVSGTSGATLAFDDVDSTTSASTGVRLSGLGAGTFSANSSSTLTNPSGIDFDLDGGSGAVTYDGTITDDVGQLVRVQNTTGGTKDFNGTISDGGDGDGSGIALTSNTGATVRFDGGLTLATGANPAFAATGGGTVAVTDPAGSTSNTIVTTTATALNVANTSIADDDLTFEKISSNGAASGVVLNTTSNANGSLNVTGNGGSCTSVATCSGGAVQASTGSGVALTSVPGGVSLTRMAITGSADDGVTGTTVGGNGFDLDNAWINANGNAPTTGGIHGDHGVDFTGLTGTSTFTSSSVSGNADSNVVVSDASGTLNLNVTGGTYSGAGGGMGDGIYVEGSGTGSQNLNVQGPITFANNVGDHVQHNGLPTSTADSDVTINNATMSEPAGGGTALGGGITVVEGGPTSGGGSNTDVTLTNNNIQNAVIGAIAVGTTGSVVNQQIANVDATITGNTIGATGVAGSGSTQGNGIFVDSNGNSVVNTLITDNTVRQWTNRSGIDLDVLDGDAQMAATVRNNVLTEPNSAFAGTTTRGMTLQLGAGQAGDSVDVCLDIGDATTAALKNQVFGTGESPQPDVRYLNEGPSSAIQLVGYSGPSSPAIGDIAGWFQPRNNLGGTPSVTGTATAAGATTTGAASCTLPAG